MSLAKTRINPLGIDWADFNHADDLADEIETEPPTPVRESVYTRDTVPAVPIAKQHSEPTLVKALSESGEVLIDKNLLGVHRECLRRNDPLPVFDEDIIEEHVLMNDPRTFSDLVKELLQELNDNEQAPITTETPNEPKSDVVVRELPTFVDEEIIRHL